MLGKGKRRNSDVFRGIEISGVEWKMQFPKIIKGIYFYDCSIVGIDFTDRNFKSVKFDCCTIRDCDFRGAKFKNVSFENSWLDQCFMDPDWQENISVLPRNYENLIVYGRE